jgi:6-phosphofructokinase 1
MSKLVGILTSGGDTPGLNAAMRAVGKTLEYISDYKLVGFHDGFRGLMENRFVELDNRRLSNILTEGGTILGSSREKPHKMLVGGKIVDMTDVIVGNYHKNHLSGLICLGGGGTQKNAYRLAKAGLDILTLPKTIDNDVYGTDVTFGYDTALSIATEAIDRLHTTASSHHRIMIIETMGHRVGWLALASGVAGGADVILLPEIPYDEQKVAEAIIHRSREGKRFSILVVGEGAISTEMYRKLYESGKKDKTEREIKAERDRMVQGRTAALAESLAKKTKMEVRVTILGYVQRGGTPTAFDRVLSTELGSRCAQEVIKESWGSMIAFRNNKIVTVPLKEVVGGTKSIPPDHYLLQSARNMGICLGD